MGKFLDALKNIGLKVNGKKPTSTTTVGVLNDIAADYVAPQEALTFDTTPTANSTNPVTSGGIKTYVDGLMSGALKRAIVEELPAEDIDTNTIYMVLDATAAQGNVYNEYLYINEAWELIGTTATSGGGTQLYLYKIKATTSVSVSGQADKTAEVYATVISPNDYDVSSEDANIDEVLFNLVQEQANEEDGRFINTTSVTLDNGYEVEGLQYYDQSGDEGIMPIYKNFGALDASIEVTYISKKSL